MQGTFATSAVGELNDVGWPASGSSPLPADRAGQEPAPRFLFYSHDGLGLGHTRRHLAIAAALNELAPDAPVLLATGVDGVNRLGLPPNVSTLKLPGLRKIGNDSYISRRLRIPLADILVLRSALMTATVNSFHPTVMLVDKHPIGVRGELIPALESVRAAGGRAILGLRDILDELATVLREWSRYDLASHIDRYYAEVLIYGQQAVFDPLAQYNFSPAIGNRARFCGYVVNQPPKERRFDHSLSGLLTMAHGRPVVLATAGGGEDGFSLLENFMRAATNAPWRGVVVAGPMSPPDKLELLECLSVETGIALHTFLPGLNGLIGSVDGLVCMGGYNTLVEAISTGTPTVCVPRIAPRTEQLIRAQAFERLGLLRVIKPEKLNPQLLLDEVTGALRLSRRQLVGRAHAALKFDGARQAANHLLALAETTASAQAIVNEPRAR